MDTIKQIIVIRRDLKMRRGKEIAQGAHASTAWINHRLSGEDGVNELYGYFSDIEIEWLANLQTKICLQVESEEELRNTYEQARQAGIEAHLITDAGLTEFNGIPTVTCLAIGPDLSSKIDPITKHLKLY